MKTLKQHIFEKLKVSKNPYTLFPKTKEELKHMIEDEISKNGNGCSLNHIDVSKITDMSDLFVKSEFNGDISDWNVSNVKNMKYMFENSRFNRDISGWDVSNVTDMNRMFGGCQSLVELNLTSLDTSKVTDMNAMFEGCKNLEIFV